MSAPYPLPDHPAAAWVSPNVAWEHFTGWTEEPEDLIDDRFGPDPSEIVAVGVCGGCHERRTLVAHGAVCTDCLDDLMPYAGCPPCPVCGDPILSDDPDLTHTPGTERYHADCCPECNPGEPDA